MTNVQHWIWAGCLIGATMAAAEDKRLEPVDQWSGSIPDKTLLGKPAVAIGSQKAWEAQWNAWKLGGIPKVDFEKHFVVLQTTEGGRLNLSLLLTAEGDLKVAALATRDLRPGFRYAMAAVPRADVKTVNGQPLSE